MSTTAVPGDFDSDVRLRPAGGDGTIGGLPLQDGALLAGDQSVVLPDAEGHRSSSPWDGRQCGKFGPKGFFRFYVLFDRIFLVFFEEFFFFHHLGNEFEFFRFT